MLLEFKEYKEALPEKAVLPELEYSYKEVEELMSEEMLKLHYTKLHQGYIDRYNKGIEKMKIKSIGEPKTQEEKSLMFNLGGYLNHALFWRSFSPYERNYECSKELGSLVKDAFGGMEKLFELFESKLPLIMGSGWIWLVYNRKTKKLEVEITMNQDFPQEGVLLLNIDMWEHAYYLQYKVDKIKYLKTVCKTLNWRYASERLKKASQ